MRIRVVLASILALLLGILAGVGAPSSEFAPKGSWWWTLDPLMFPALFAGVVLAFIALLVSCVPSGVRGAASLCLLASLSTAIGVVVAWGTSDHGPFGFYAVFIAVITIPALAAVSILKHGRQT